MTVCGFAGALDTSGTVPPEQLTELARRMAATLVHRGPDAGRACAEASGGYAVGHRRLAILDLGPGGDQPMVSADGRWLLAYNGEVYNHRELRARLEGGGHRFRGRSDTEVLVEAIAAWGLDRAVAAVNGMFAFAAWDRHEQRLHLVRDRIGEKPLYYAWVGGDFVFASELRALHAHPDLDAAVDGAALAAYLRRSFVPAPHTILAGVRQLPPGCSINLTAYDRGRLPEPAPYWTVADVAERGLACRDGAIDDAADDLEGLLRDAVRLRLHADVPVGAFLSGGVDSSLVAALAQQETAGRLRTFTVAFPGTAQDEASDARAVAHHLGTDHTELAVDAGDAVELVERLVEVYDEPFADPSAIPTALMCAAAREHVTVCLSGDGGDEVFAGYNRYTLGRTAWRWARPLPRPLRATAGRLLLRPSPAAWDTVAGRIGGLLPRALRVRNPGDKAHKLGVVLGSTDADDLYRRLVSHWPDPAALVAAGVPEATGLDQPVPAALTDPIERMVYRDQASTLPDDMLVKVDRASMASSLEVRVPLLDHRVVEAAWRLPLGVKLAGGVGKAVLRRVLHRHVPAALGERPKMGFDPPLADWLRGPLRTWASELLDPERLRSEGHLRAEPVQRAWAEHQSGARNHDYALWTVLMFQAWCQRWRP